MMSNYVAVGDWLIVEIQKDSPKGIFAMTDKGMVDPRISVSEGKIVSGLSGFVEGKIILWSPTVAPFVAIDGNLVAIKKESVIAIKE